MPKIRPGPRKRPEGPRGGPTPSLWSGRLRLWIDTGGRNALGPGKVSLLDAIASTKSLADAARALRMSYRQAWKHIKFVEERTGLTVVEPKRGGRHGGGTKLTAEGKALLEAYHGFRRDVEDEVTVACERHFGPWSHLAAVGPPLAATNSNLPSQSAVPSG